MNESAITSTLAKLLDYPTEEFKNHLSHCTLALHQVLHGEPATSSESREKYGRFERAVTALSVEEVQELYTRTFDISPVASLEVGWHLYGEAYERGAFLVKMRELLRSCGIQESTELPDHLSYLLLALSHLERDQVGKFIQVCLAPAVEKMLAGFEDETNPYRYLLEAIQVVLHHHQLSMMGV